MAYTTYIRFEHHDFNGDLSRFDIMERDFAGEYITRTLEGNEPLIVTYGNKSGEGLPIVYGSEAVLKFFADADMEFLSLFTSDSKKYRIDHYFNESLMGSWFLEPEKWSEPLTAPPYIVEATATDGLGSLKDLNFTDENGDAYTGRKTFLEIIKLILDKTGLTLAINTSVAWKETTQTAGTDPLAIHTIDCKIFAELNCYEIIEQLLTGCRLFQRLGQWWIISNDQFENDTINYFHYAWPSVTTHTTATANLKASGYWIQDEPQLEMLAAIKQLTVIQDYGYNANVLENGSFDTFNEELARFEGWVNNGVTPQQRQLNDSGDKYIYIPGKQYPDTFANQGYGLITDSISKTKQVSQTDSVINFSLSYAEMGSAYSSLMFIGIRFNSAFGDYYLRRKPYMATREDQGFEWINYTWLPNQGDDYITLKSHAVYISSAPHTGEYGNTYDNVTAYSSADIADHFETFKASIPGFPSTGELQIILYVPYTNRPQIAGSCFTGVKVEILDETAENYPTQSAIRATNDLNNNQVPDDITLLIGDYPDVVNSDIIYNGGIARADLSHTTGWTINGHTYYYTFAEFIARLQAASQAIPRQNYQIRLTDIIPGLNMVIDDINTTGRRLVENGISYDNRMQAIEGQYTEVLTINLEQPTVEVNTTFDTPQSSSSGSSSSSSGTATPVNIDERVSIMNDLGMKTSPPSFMDDTYFEAIQNEDTGQSLIRPKQAHPPVTVAENSAAFGSIGEDQVLTITPINIASGITYFLHEEIDTPTGYESALTIPAEDAQDADSITVNASEGEKLIDTYITAVGDPNTTVIPSGAWKFTTYTHVGTVIGVTEIVIRVYKRTIADVETELFNTSFVIDSTTVKQYDKLSVQQEINLALTDRLVFKYYAKTTSVPDRTVTLYYEGTDHYSHIDTPIKALAMHNPVTIASESQSRASINENQELTINPQGIPYDLDFEFADFVLGTAKTYTLDLKAKRPYTIEGIVLETDTGTFTGIAVKIGSTDVTSLSNLTASTIAETASTGAKTVALGDRVSFVLPTGYTGTPTTVRGKLLRQLI